MNFLCILITCMLRVSLIFGSEEGDEPKCFSRWDYEYKTIRQLAKTEDKQEQLEHIINNQQQLIEELQGSINFFRNEGKPRSVFTRWGRNICSGSSTIIYKGYTAGKHYSQPGGGSDTICLPNDPTWSNYTDGNAASNRGYIYGTEIDIVDPSNIFPFNVNQQDLPCVVCLSAGSVSLMIPAREDCYPGWTREYSGYLMAGYYNHPGAHNHVCVDSEPEFLPKGDTNDNEHILYLAEAQCGSLPCPPYVNGRELACVVCSK